MKTNVYDRTIETIVPIFENMSLEFSLNVLEEVKNRLIKNAVITKLSS